KVLLSHHSSPGELVRFVSCLRPTSVHPCVLDTRQPDLHASAIANMLAPYLRREGGEPEVDGGRWVHENTIGELSGLHYHFRGETGGAKPFNSPGSEARTREKTEPDPVIEGLLARLRQARPVPNSAQDVVVTLREESKPVMAQVPTHHQAPGRRIDSTPNKTQHVYTALAGAFAKDLKTQRGCDFGVTRNSDSCREDQEQNRLNGGADGIVLQCEVDNELESLTVLETEGHQTGKSQDDQDLVHNHREQYEEPPFAPQPPAAMSPYHGKLLLASSRSKSAIHVPPMISCTRSNRPPLHPQRNPLSVSATPLLPVSTNKQFLRHSPPQALSCKRCRSRSPDAVSRRAEDGSVVPVTPDRDVRLPEVLEVIEQWRVVLKEEKNIGKRRKCGADFGSSLRMWCEG
ncbi:hypothetical protein HDU93_009047, partial [Gonapodya sp. JEL0774]